MRVSTKLAIVALIPFLATACGKKSKSSNNNETGQSEDLTTLTLPVSGTVNKQPWLLKTATVEKSKDNTTGAVRYNIGLYPSEYKEPCFHATTVNETSVQFGVGEKIGTFHSDVESDSENFKIPAFSTVLENGGSSIGADGTLEITKIDDTMIHGRLALSSFDGDKVADIFDATICK